MEIYPGMQPERGKEGGVEDSSRTGSTPGQTPKGGAGNERTAGFSLSPQSAPEANGIWVKNHGGGI